MMIKLAVICILITAPWALWGVLCALTAINVRTTRSSHAAGFLLCAIGWAVLIAVGLDYLVSAAPLFWPLAMLIGVLLLSLGNAAIYLANRRSCSCPSCPGRLARREQVHG